MLKHRLIFPLLLWATALAACTEKDWNDWVGVPTQSQSTPAPEPDRSPLQIRFASVSSLPSDRRGYLDINITHRGGAIALDDRRQVWISADRQSWDAIYTVSNTHPPPQTVALDPDNQAFFIGHDCANACYSLISRDGKELLRDPLLQQVKHASGETYAYPIHDAHWDRGIWVGLGRLPNRGGQALSLPDPLRVTTWMRRPLLLAQGQQPRPAFVAAVTADDSGQDYLGIWDIANAAGNQGVGMVLLWNDTLGQWLRLGRNQPQDDLPNEVPLSMGARGKGRLAILYSASGILYQHVGAGIPWREGVPSGISGKARAIALDPEGHMWLATSSGLFRSEAPLP